MYYVAKVYQSTTPSIVESFEDIKDAFDYAEIMSRAGKGTYIVLSCPDSPYASK